MPGEVFIRVVHAMRSGQGNIFNPRSIHKRQLHGWQSAGTGREEHAAIREAKFHRLAVDFQQQAIGQRRRFLCEVCGKGSVAFGGHNSRSLNFLVGWNFRHVHEISQLNAVALDVNRRVVADAEISHGMRKGRTRRHKRRPRRQCKQQEHPESRKK